ncbi:MAG: hypothetical protein Q8K60_04085 [Parachlamydiaceae bacterium]|nr:hypothetical protein [Parachlamydiaceae bacterium]
MIRLMNNTYNVELAIKLLGPKDHLEFAPKNLFDHLILKIKNLGMIFYRLKNKCFGDGHWYNNRLAFDIINHYGTNIDNPIYNKIKNLSEELLYRNEFSEKIKNINKLINKQNQTVVSAFTEDFYNSGFGLINNNDFDLNQINQLNHQLIDPINNKEMNDLIERDKIIESQQNKIKETNNEYALLSFKLDNLNDDSTIEEINLLRLKIVDFLEKIKDIDFIDNINVINNKNIVDQIKQHKEFLESKIKNYLNEQTILIEQFQDLNLNDSIEDFIKNIRSNQSNLQIFINAKKDLKLQSIPLNLLKFDEINKILECARNKINDELDKYKI